MRTGISIDNDDIFRRRAQEKVEARDRLFGEGGKEHRRQRAEHRKRIKIGKPAFAGKF